MNPLRLHKRHRALVQWRVLLCTRLPVESSSFRGNGHAVRMNKLSGTDTRPRGGSVKRKGRLPPTDTPMPEACRECYIQSSWTPCGPESLPSTCQCSEGLPAIIIGRWTVPGQSRLGSCQQVHPKARCSRPICLEIFQSSWEATVMRKLAEEFL